MKYSGIEWIGSIPNNWKLNKIGSLFNFRNEKVSDKYFQPLSVSKGGVVLQMENVAKSNASDERKLVLNGDFAINSRSDRKQSCGLSKYDGSVSLINIVLYQKNKHVIFNNYINYLLKNYGFAEEFYRWGHGIVADLWTTRWQEMKNIMLPFPSYKTQEKITNILDEKVSQLDELINIEKKQIESLNEYKEKVIRETINKESGVETKLKYICNSFNSNISAGSLMNTESKIKVYGASGLAGYSCDENGISAKYIGIIKDGAGVGKVNIYEKDTLLVGTMAYIIPNDNIDLNWLLYVIKSLDLGLSIDKTTIPHIYFSEYGNRVINKISYDKQLKVAEYLDKKCYEIDCLINIKNLKIEKIIEYKKSLIYEYVTGKKEVMS